MKVKFMIIAVIAFAMSVSPLYASEQKISAEKPKIEEAVKVTLEATVEAVDQETRMVTLKNSDGKSFTFKAGEEVKNLAQVEVGDLLTIDYIEAVSVEVFAPEDIASGAAAVATAGRAKPGEKPAGVVVQEVTMVTTIAAIDTETQMVTLMNASGETKTVKARNPENLKKVKVGDKVKITVTEALAINMTKKPACK